MWKGLDCLLKTEYRFHAIWSKHAKGLHFATCSSKITSKHFNHSLQS